MASECSGSYCTQTTALTNRFNQEPFPEVRDLMADHLNELTTQPDPSVLRSKWEPARFPGFGGRLEHCRVCSSANHPVQARLRRRATGLTIAASTTTPRSSTTRTTASDQQSRQMTALAADASSVELSRSGAHALLPLTLRVFLESYTSFPLIVGTIFHTVISLIHLNFLIVHPVV
jgi:hypothetical protein